MTTTYGGAAESEYVALEVELLLEGHDFSGAYAATWLSPRRIHTKRGGVRLTTWTAHPIRRGMSKGIGPLGFVKRGTTTQGDY